MREQIPETTVYICDKCGRRDLIRDATGSVKGCNVRFKYRKRLEVFASDQTTTIIDLCNDCVDVVNKAIQGVWADGLSSVAY